MSHYTTQVRYICETYAGRTESGGFDDIDEIIEAALPKIFNFDFPLYDESYRQVLEKKIIEHYYTREIGEETVGLWKLRLKDKLNLIMPYYNQLYKSELLRFNPMYDVDYQTTYTKNGNTDRTENIDVIGNSKVDRDTTSTGHEDYNENENRHLTGNEDTKTKNDNVIDTIGHRDENESTTTDNVTTTDNMETKTDSGTIDTTGDKNGTSKDTRTDNITSKTEHDFLKTTNEESNGTDKSTTTHDNESGSTTHSEGKTKEVRSEHREVSGWNLFNDTPQGGLQGINLRDDILTYLTTATKTTSDDDLQINGTVDRTDDTTTNGTDSGTTTTNGETSNDTAGTITDVGEETTTQTGTVGNDGTTTEKTTGKETRDLTGTSDFDGTVTLDGEGSRTLGQDETGKRTEDLTGTKAVGTIEDRTMENTRERFTTEAGTEDVVTDTTTNRGEKENIQNLEDYAEHVFGKKAINRNFSQLLLDFRATFLNIDAMIIEELNGLFFGLFA